MFHGISRLIFGVVHLEKDKSHRILYRPVYLVRLSGLCDLHQGITEFRYLSELFNASSLVIIPEYETTSSGIPFFSSDPCS